MKDNPGILVIGGGGHALVVISTLQAANIPIAAVLDDNPDLHGSKILGVEVAGSIDCLENSLRTQAILALGDNRARQHLAASYSEVQWTTVVHPHAYMHPSVQLHAGTVVFAGAVIQPGTTIGAHSIVNTGATVDHGCVVGAFAHLAPGSHLAGDVNVGEGTFFGIGASAITGVEIGEWSVVGAGAAVVQNIPARVTAVGVPARLL